MKGEGMSFNLTEQISLLNKDKFIFIDTETTSRYQPNENYAKLIEIAGIKVENDIHVDTFQTLINPHMKLPKIITEVTGITDGMLVGKPSYEQALGKFYDFVKGDYVFVMHNASFDMNYLNYYGQRCGILFNNPILDTLFLAKQIIPKQKDVKGQYKLENLCNTYGINDPEHHRALNDVTVTWKFLQVLRRLVFEKYGTYKPQLQLSDSHTQVKEVNDFKVTKISPWEKWNKRRLYVTLFSNGGSEPDVANVFYDFDEKSWRIKDTTFLIKDFSLVEKKVLALKGLALDGMNDIRNFY